ncbi:MAG TPA: hypothetical protein ENN51_06230 [candidate division WOR-3 bacterium]|uniref:Uncharacterized protein n=1 Tax=candidate division WOR-3 bacterium TaxID=2052148 RepID=A0A7V0XFA6_UNCW3|nr:hypothetical protein [candidate division WOR-3 bacterium]
MKAVAILLMALASVSLGLVQVYSVEPVKAAWSGWTRTILGQDTISQTITCNWDSIVYCELFVGDFSDTGAYKVDVYELPGGTNRVAYNDGENATRPHTWVKMPLTTVSGQSFTKGKQYEFK